MTQTGWEEGGGELAEVGGPCGCRFTGHGNPEDLAPGLLKALHLGYGGRYVVGLGGGHGLNGDRRPAPYGHASNHDLPGMPAIDKLHLTGSIQEKVTLGHRLCQVERRFQPSN